MQIREKSTINMDLRAWRVEEEEASLRRTCFPCSLVVEEDAVVVDADPKREKTLFTLSKCL